MRRLFEILTGIVLLAVAWVFFYQPWLTDFEQQFDGRLLVGSLLCGFIGMACMVCWKRPITTRIWLGYLCFLMVCMIVDVVRSDELSWQIALLAAIVGMLSGGYTLSGYYPRSFPIAQVFCKNQPPADP